MKVVMCFMQPSLSRQYVINIKMIMGVSFCFLFNWKFLKPVWN